MQKPRSFEQMHTGSLNSVCFGARRLKKKCGEKTGRTGKEGNFEIKLMLGEANGEELWINALYIEGFGEDGVEKNRGDWWSEMR